jgi:hypothetical protein
MRTIYRQVIAVDDRWHTVELRGPILHIAARNEDAVEFWHLHDTDQPATAHTFRVVGTGHTLPPVFDRYVGTAITPSGALAWHLIEHTRTGGTDG